MARRRPRTVLEACVAVRGVHAGALTAAHVAQAVMTTLDLGHFPSGAEYARWWAINDRTTFRQWEGIREVFGDDWREVVEQLADQVHAQQLDARPGVIRGLPLTA